MPIADYDLEYPLVGVFMDSSRSPDNLPEGFCSRLVGVDGRFPGTVRKYPGHVKVYDTNYESPTFFRYVASYDTADDVQVRGFMVRTGGALKYRYRDSAGSGWVGETVEEPDGTEYTAGTGTMDVTTKGRFIYIFVSGDDYTPMVMYHSGTGDAWDYDLVGAHTDNEVAAVTDVIDAPVERPGGHATTGGHLHHRGRYKVMVKFYHSVRKVYSGRSKEYEFTLDEGTLETHLHGITIHDYPTGTPTDNLDEDFDFVEVYRTQNLRNPLSDAYNGAVYYREQLLTRSAQGNITAQVGTMDDVSLVQQKQYDPWMDPIAAAPDSGAAGYYEGSVFAGQDSGTDGGVGLVWTNPRIVGTEEFGSEFKYEGSPTDGIVRRIIQMGDYAYAVAGSVIYLIRKIGADVAVNRLVEGRSPINANCVCKVDRNLAILTGEGLYFITAGGNCTLVSALDGVLRDEWAGQMDDCSMAYDEAMSCIYILNPDAHEAICFWTNTRSVSLLEGVGARFVTDGPDVMFDTDTWRSYWIDNDGKVVTPDFARTPTTGWDGGTVGLVGNINGYKRDDIRTVGVGEDEDTIAVGANPGETFYVMSGNDEGLWGYSNGTTMESGSSLGGTPALAEGDTYLVSPIKVALRLWPVRPPVGTYAERFARKVVKSIAVKATGVADFTQSHADSANQVKIGVYRNQKGQSDETLAGSDLVAISENPSDCIVTLNHDGVTLEPYVEQVSSGTDFELTGVLIKGTITVSKNLTT